ncbi:MAG: enolase C-terminal domain-like protein [Chloroflexota bacterium]
MAGKPTDVRPMGAQLYLLPMRARIPVKFGPETTRDVTSARVCLQVKDRHGASAEGWGETPLSVSWVWPSSVPLAEREEALQTLCAALTTAWARFEVWGHPLEVGHAFLERELPRLLDQANARRAGHEAIPWLAALVCCSAFDLALHDAYGMLHDVGIYTTYNAHYMNADLAAYLTPDAMGGATAPSFAGTYPEEFLVQSVPDHLIAWHLVGGKDPLEAGDLDGSEPQDGYPLLLRDWVRRDDLRCLKVKLRGNDAAWDNARLIAVGRIALEEGCPWLTADFNCTVSDPAYVNTILDRLLAEEPRLYGMLLYVEQPFAYDLEHNRMDVRSVAARKPLFMDESAHDWQLIRLGRQLGWSGVALKTCKTQTGAILSLCWARAHGMPLMVQDLSNNMLGQIPHLLLAGHAGTIMGVESNGMQYYPQASLLEAAVHPGLYTRRDGQLDISTLAGPGFGYGRAITVRTLPEPAATA